MARPSFTLLLITVSAAAGVLSALVWAGPLNPPAGPVTSSYKTLSEVEPRTAISAANTPGDADSLFKITQPGSYYLTGNITGVAGKHGIEIAASGVTLDLNGFDLVGVPSMGAFDGVNITIGSLTNIAVINGSIRNWGDAGVDMGPIFATSNSRIADVRASGNSGLGIRASGGCNVINCSAYSNGGGGMNIFNGSTATNCSAHSNTGTGMTFGEGCVLENCAANQNSSGGIIIASGCSASNCSAYSNTGGGISNGVGIGCTVSHCTTNGNTGSGITVGSGSIVTECTNQFNTLDGITCSAACVIRANICTYNGSGAGDGAGIHATDSDNRIEDNNCISADRGIDVDASGNIIIRNSCSGNTTNWAIAANNICGPIVDRSIPGSAAINGNSAPDSTGSTHPSTNFTY